MPVCAYSLSLADYLLAKRSETHLGNLKTPKTKRNPNNGQAKRDAPDYRRQPQPKSGEHNPNDIQYKSASTGIAAADNVFAKWEKGKTSERGWPMKAEQVFEAAPGSVTLLYC